VFSQHSRTFPSSPWWLCRLTYALFIPITQASSAAMVIHLLLSAGHRRIWWSRPQMLTDLSGGIICQWTDMGLKGKRVCISQKMIEHSLQHSSTPKHKAHWRAYRCGRGVTVPFGMKWISVQYDVLLLRLCHFSSGHTDTLKTASLFETWAATIGMAVTW
jgi:hypothetical protein